MPSIAHENTCGGRLPSIFWGRIRRIYKFQHLDCGIYRSERVEHDSNDIHSLQGCIGLDINPLVVHIMHCVDRKPTHATVLDRQYERIAVGCKSAAKKTVNDSPANEKSSMNSSLKEDAPPGRSVGPPAPNPTIPPSATQERARLNIKRLPTSLSIATWQNGRPKLAGLAFLPLGADYAPRWRRFALRRRGELGGHQSGSACEAAGLHNRRGSRFWVQGSLLATQDHPVDDLDAPPRPLRLPCPRDDRTTPAHALPPQNEQRLFARSPSTVAAVYTVAGPLRGIMQTVFRAPTVNLSSPLPTVCLNNPSLAHHNAHGVPHVQHSIGSLHNDYKIFPTTNAINANLIRATRYPHNSLPLHEDQITPAEAPPHFKGPPEGREEDGVGGDLAFPRTKVRTDLGFA
ncbi:hypothetical protein F5146DRAFT_1125309 [Armillaria mellea]|nr:hypothetical protein F5146DRAFT_1125309 [Armillaria mellea]